MHAIITSYMLLLYYTPVVMVIMYRAMFTVGIAVTRAMPGNNAIVSANAIDDYSYINARESNFNIQIARCVTGLGPNNTEDNSDIGEVYFDGSSIPFVACTEGGSAIVQPRPASNLDNNVGVVNIVQCRAFTTTAEGIYTCTMINSSMMEQSVRFGVYFTGRSESLIIYISSFNHLSPLHTAAPVIDTPSSSTVTVNANSSLTLSCTSRGSPPDTFTWMKDGNQTVLQSTSITAVNYTSTSAVFRADYSIDSVTTSDSGTYTCTVTNPIGSNSAIITVIVNGKALI